MNQKGLKLVLAAFMALALSAFVTGAAMAELSISGAAHGSFGNYTNELDVSSAGKTYSTTSDEGFRTDSQAQIDISGGSGPVSAKMRLRVREDSATELAVQRNAVTWKASDQLTIVFNGQSFGNGASGYGIAGGQGTFGDGMPIGDQYGGFTTWANTTGIDVGFNLGVGTVGLMITDGCKPSCGVNLNSTFGANTGHTGGAMAPVLGAGEGSGSINAESMAPYFYGTFGAIKVTAFMSNATADDQGTSTDGLGDSNVSYESTGTQLGVQYTMGDIKAGFLYSTTAQSGNSDATQGGLADMTDIEGTNLALGFIMGAIKAHYSTANSEWSCPASAGTCVLTKDATEIAVAYTMDVGGATVIPQFATRTTEVTDEPSTPAEGWEQTQTYLGVGVVTGF